MKKSILILILFIFSGFSVYSQKPEKSERKQSLGILDMASISSKAAETDLISVEHIAQVGGMPYSICTTLEEALQHQVLIFSAGPDANDLTSSERAMLQNYILHGGCVISNRLRDESLLSTFGLSTIETNNQRYRIIFDTSLHFDFFRMINEDYERTISIGKSEGHGSMNSSAYGIGTATVLARYDDGEAAITQNKLGAGAAYNIGIRFKNIILQSQLNLDIESERCYSNCFEPSSDVITLLIRDIYLNQVKYGVYKHTAPNNFKASLIITHDVCSNSAHEGMNAFADLEVEFGAKAMYTITTHEFADDVNGNNYTPHIDLIKQLVAKGMEIGSHSYGHFPDFGNEDIIPFGSLEGLPGDYNPRHIEESTIGASLLGETYVSKYLLEKDAGIQVRTFRSGHLQFPKKLVNALEMTGYDFNSSLTASDVLTSFPYYEQKDYSYSGGKTHILELPLLISDVFPDEPLDETNYMDKVAVWLDVAKKVADNNSFINLLIHPNRDYKVTAQRAFMEGLPKGIIALSPSEAGDFWNNRNTVTFSYQQVGHQMEIIIPDSCFPLDSKLSFIIHKGICFENALLRSESGAMIEGYNCSKYGNEDMIVYQQNATTAISSPRNETPGFIAGAAYPNPTSSEIHFPFILSDEAYIRVELFDMTGKKTQEIQQSYFTKGQHEIIARLNKNLNGLAFYSILIVSNGQVYKVSNKFLIHKCL